MSHPFTQAEFDAIYARVPRLTVEVVLRGPRGVFLTRRSAGPCRRPVAHPRGNSPLRGAPR